jgi:CHAT domain-containing protein
MTDTFAHELIQIELGPRTDQIIGGFIHAQLGNGLSLLSDREWLAAHEEPREGFAVLTQGWEDETFRQRALSLYEHCKVSNQTSSLNKAAQAILNNPALAPLVDQPLRHLKDEEKNILANTLDHYFLSQELQVSLDRLSTYALSPLLTWLHEQGTTSLTLIPCGWLTALPLAAVSLDDGRTFGETIPTSSAPSARSLLQNQETPETNRSGVYAIGDPRPTYQELPWGEAEALTIAKLARSQKLGGQARVQEKATRRWFSDALRLGKVVDASCHGSFDSSNFLQSALHLAGGYALPLGTLLSHEVDLQGLRLMILSACQTAIADLGGAREEVRSLASGMLQAGAQGVLAALWSVDDRATYLLMVRFAQEWFPKINDEPPATALARAQHWLRTVTNRKLLEWEATEVPAISSEERREAGAGHGVFSSEQREAPAPTGEKKLAAVRGRGNRYEIGQAVEEVRRRAGQEIDLDACPYADPIYWAAFQVTGW